MVYLQKPQPDLNHSDAQLNFMHFEITRYKVLTTTRTVVTYGYIVYNYRTVEMLSKL